MPIGYEQLFEKVKAAGLLAPSELSSVASILATEGHTGDASEMARLLVRENMLTKYQAAAVYQDKIETLILGNYVILDRLGAGGMGQVYRARHRKMDRIVAIKVLSKKLLNSPDAVERFKREVKAAARVTHMNIVTAFDADEADGMHFLVMEYVEGNDLSKLVKERGPLPIPEVVDYVRQAACGLARAHADGIVHRDIKPSNLLVDKHGTVKILDMGLARIEGQGGIAAEVDAAAGLTQQGSVMGTIDYMAPEQAVDVHKADARSDLYSLGCTLHFLLVGRAPFGGDSLMARLLAHRDAPIPSLTAQRKDVPASLDKIFQRLVAKRTEDRFRSAGELVESLNQPITQKPLPVATPTSVHSASSSSRKSPAKRKTSKAGLGLFGIIGIVLGGVGGLSIAYLILVFFKGSSGDFLHIFPQSQSPVAVAERKVENEKPKAESEERKAANEKPSSERVKAAAVNPQSEIPNPQSPTSPAVASSPIAEPSPSIDALPPAGEVMPAAVATIPPGDSPAANTPLLPLQHYATAIARHRFGGGSKTSEFAYMLVLE